MEVHRTSAHSSTTNKSHVDSSLRPNNREPSGDPPLGCVLCCFVEWHKRVTRIAILINCWTLCNPSYSPSPQISDAVSFSQRFYQFQFTQLLIYSVGRAKLGSLSTAADTFFFHSSPATIFFLPRILQLIHFSGTYFDILHTNSSNPLSQSSYYQ